MISYDFMGFDWISWPTWPIGDTNVRNMPELFTGSVNQAGEISRLASSKKLGDPQSFSVHSCHSFHHRFSHEEVPFLWGVTDVCSMTSENFHVDRWVFRGHLGHGWPGRLSRAGRVESRSGRGSPAGTGNSNVEKWGYPWIIHRIKL